jgi:hypothetical protein
VTDRSEPLEPPVVASELPVHPTKYPSGDRAALLPTAGQEPGLSLEEAIRGANRATLRVEAAKAELERLEIVRRFPLDEWPSMPLERYALGLPSPDVGMITSSGPTVIIRTGPTSDR